MLYPLLVVALCCSLNSQVGRIQKKQPDPGRALAERIANYAGGTKAYAKLSNIVFHATTTRTRRGRTSKTEALWLLAPHAKRVRWENPAPPAPNRARGVRREIMVMAPPDRKNLLTVPESRPRVSLWAQWHRVHRQMFLPFAIVDPKVQCSLRPAAKGDRVGVKRLRIVWPKTRNYDYIDELELLVEVDSGRIVELTEISGTRGQNRVTYAMRWAKAGGLRLPVAYDVKTKDARQGSLAVSQLRVDTVLPKDAWERKTKFLVGLRPKPKKTPGPKKAP